MAAPKKPVATATSLADLGLPVSMAEVGMTLRKKFEEVFGATAS